ncbi:hypothetical protein DPMN_090782 [Dreissena polymorpha]|uniref:Uncharacterized protein n=1 Tax=Dreissena polymorpha TaxID=45954 RepID=A0A9D4KYD4_DREPO|nr:hypothetical protein DPMN_090782 [Dreissena polymorpha]
MILQVEQMVTLEGHTQVSVQQVESGIDLQQLRWTLHRKKCSFYLLWAAVTVGASSKTVQSVSWSPSPLNSETAMLYIAFISKLFPVPASPVTKMLNGGGFVPATRLS